MTDTPPTDEPTPAPGTDLIDFVNNGTVSLGIGNQRHRLRRPKVGEFRVLRESYLAMVDEIVEAVDDDAIRARKIDERMGALGDRRGGQGEPLTDDEEAEFRKLRAEGRGIVREQQERFAGLRLGWFREVFDTLAEKGRLPEEDDDLEPWLADAGFQSRLVVHWQSVPLARGGR